MNSLIFGILKNIKVVIYNYFLKILYIISLTLDYNDYILFYYNKIEFMLIIKSQLLLYLFLFSLSIHINHKILLFIFGINYIIFIPDLIVLSKSSNSYYYI